MSSRKRKIKKETIKKIMSLKCLSCARVRFRV